VVGGAKWITLKINVTRYLAGSRNLWPALVQTVTTNPAPCSNSGVIRSFFFSI
jgi:hypothetical protein